MASSLFEIRDYRMIRIYDDSGKLAKFHDNLLNILREQGEYQQSPRDDN